ncbi:MAG: hypothetical protein V1753_04850 [Pseudomonadota bacterium]
MATSVLPLSSLEPQPPSKAKEMPKCYLVDIVDLSYNRPLVSPLTNRTNVRHVCPGGQAISLKFLVFNG